MAARVTVVLAQFPRRQSDRQQLEEDLVGGLLMEDGIEVTVIADVQELEDDETGLLCLEGIRGEMVLLSWHDSRRAHQLLQGIGIEARFGETPLSTPTSQDAELPSEMAAASRRIFHMDLRQSADGTTFRSEIQQIREALSARTVDPFQSLGANLLAPPTLGGNRDEKSPTTPSASNPSSQREQVESEQASRNEPVESERLSGEVDDYEDDDQLDALLDQLDELDH